MLQPLGAKCLFNSVFPFLTTFPNFYSLCEVVPKALRGLFRRHSFIFVFTFFFSEMTMFIIFREEGRGQRRDFEWGSWLEVEGFEPAVLTSKRH